MGGWGTNGISARAPATEGEPDGHRVADEDRGHDRVTRESTGASGAEPRSGEDERRRQHAQVVHQDRGDRVERGVERGVRAAGGPERGPGDGRGSTECRCRREHDPAEKRDPEIRLPTPGVGGCSTGAHARRGPGIVSILRLPSGHDQTARGAGRAGRR